MRRRSSSRRRSCSSAASTSARRRRRTAAIRRRCRPSDRTRSCSSTRATSAATCCRRSRSTTSRDRRAGSTTSSRSCRRRDRERSIARSTASRPGPTRRSTPRRICSISARRTSRRWPPRSAGSLSSPPPRTGVTARTQTVIRHFSSSTKATVSLPDAPVSIFIQETGRNGVSRTLTDKLFTTTAPSPANVRFTTTTAPSWRLLVKHPSGSLEQAVGGVRRRNLLVSTGILGVLGVSVAFLVASTRRAHDLARRQLEFVATVSHELRTPLAVIRSAADNLADGVVDDEARVKQYGDLVRREGVRLTDLVEQILEFAGLQSGQRLLTRRPVAVEDLLREVATAAQETSRYTLTVDFQIA